VEAWRTAKKSYPNLKLSVFFGRGGFYPPPDKRYPDEEIRDILASLPSEVTMRASMGCDGSDGALLRESARKGKRISRMYVVHLSYMSATFMSEDIRLRMEGIAADHYAGAWQFVPISHQAHPNAESFQQAHSFRLCALAEYSWNAKGRSAKEFAEAWAVRRGLQEPERFSAWMETMDMPQAARMLVSWPGSLFESWFGCLKDMAARKQWDETHFRPGEPEAGIRQSERGLAMAGDLGEEECVKYSRMMLAYCRLERAAVQFIASLRDEALKGKAFERLREALTEYVRTRGIVAAGASGLGGEWDSAMAELELTP
jgi:hypothetical protein